MTQVCNCNFKTPVDDDGNVNWVKEKLLSINSSKMAFSHTIIDGKVGFNSYGSTIKVLPKEHGCKTEWNYNLVPTKGRKVEDLDFFTSSSLQGIGKRITEALQA
jgi:hypothetical protein|uniref:Bet v I/Major latex protein domain-containing protein n=1 Tax=Populus trichocarpa TaxID=3694 RepID=A0A2K2A3C9_POPTR